MIYFIYLFFNLVYRCGVYKAKVVTMASNMTIQDMIDVGKNKKIMKFSEVIKEGQSFPVIGSRIVKTKFGDKFVYKLDGLPYEFWSISIFKGIEQYEPDVINDRETQLYIQKLNDTLILHTGE